MPSPWRLPEDASREEQQEAEVVAVGSFAKRSKATIRAAANACLLGGGIEGTRRMCLLMISPMVGSCSICICGMGAGAGVG